jgi:hypothetical protein
MAEEVKAADATTNNDASADGKDAAAQAAEKTAADKAAADTAAKGADKTKDAAADQTAAGKKAADEQTAKAKVEADAKAAVVPEKYDLKLPEGTIVDEPMMAEFTAFAKESKLTNDQAQKAADLHLKAIGAFAAKQAAEFTDQQKKWTDEMIGDKDLGGKKIDDTLSVARKVVSAFGTPRLKADLERTGMGNHPDLVKMFHAVGLQLGDDNKWIGTNKPAGERKSTEEVFYGGNSEAKT